MDQLAASLSDEQLTAGPAPGRNRPIYLRGHLTVTHDLLFPLLRLGERLHPELDNAYLTNPDQTVPDPVSPSALKKAWNEVNAKLTAAFEALTPAQWLERHNAVSEEDFAKEPLRNRLAVLMSGRITPHPMPGKSFWRFLRHVIHKASSGFLLNSDFSHNSDANNPPRTERCRRH